MLDGRWQKTRALCSGDLNKAGLGFSAVFQATSAPEPMERLK